MIYGTVLLLHSWLRWAVIISGVLLLLRAAASKKPWETLDQRLGIVFVSTLDTQFLLGLLLYFGLSPMTPKSFSDLGPAMHVASLRFYAVEHAFGMLIALVAAHVGWALAKRADNDAGRKKRILFGVGMAFFAIIASIPWPWLSFGRPLFRGL